MNKELKEFHDEGEKFPTEYTIDEKIKSPLNFLMYNTNFIFKDNYPAKMPLDFARDMILLYSKPGDLVWDCFNGSGTVPRTAFNYGRRGIGTDINPKAIELSQRHDPAHAASYFVGNVLNVKLQEKAKLVLTSPPFGVSIGGDKNNYSEEKEDLSNSKDIEEFLTKIEPAFVNIFDNLAANGILIFDSRDRTKDGKYYDLNRLFANMAEAAGFAVLFKYYYFQMPWQLYTYKNHETGKIMPDVSTVDIYGFYKPANARLF